MLQKQFAIEQKNHLQEQSIPNLLFGFISNMNNK